MKQQFLKVNIGWKPKNKLDAEIQNQFKGLDQVLVTSLNVAKKLARLRYEIALKNYTGKCTAEKLSEWDNMDKSCCMAVSGVVQLTIYEIQPFGIVPLSPEMDPESSGRGIDQIFVNEAQTIIPENSGNSGNSCLDNSLQTLHGQGCSSTQNGPLNFGIDWGFPARNSENSENSAIHG